MDRQMISDELNHKRDLVNALIRRRRPLELQAAHRGLSAPPEVLTEISSLTDQIRAYEEEINRLETLAAQGTAPVHEVEFSVLLAEAWDTLRGSPSITGVIRLELARLKLGILPERALAIEQEIRVALSQEAFNNIDPLFFDLVCSTNARSYFVDNIDSLKQLGRSIRLDMNTSRQLFIVNLSDKHKKEVETKIFKDQLFRANKVHQYSEDFLLFNNFIIGFTADLDSFLRSRNVKVLSQE